jgi:putative FmdB family regulatory protein
MPIYEYECQVCKRVYEELHGLREEPVVLCFHDGSEEFCDVKQRPSERCKRIMSAPGLLKVK